MKMPPPIATKFTKLVLTILAITILGIILSFISQDHTLLMLSAGVAVAGGVKIIDYYNKICVLDYDLILRDCEDGTLYRAEFGVLGDVSYGESEGIYGDIYLYGSWSKDQNDFRRNRARVYVLKTLNCDKESYLAIGMLVNLICFYANEFISKHMDHFD